MTKLFGLRRFYPLNHGWHKVVTLANWCQTVKDSICSTGTYGTFLGNSNSSSIIPEYSEAVDGGDTVGFSRSSLRYCEYFCATTKGCHSLVLSNGAFLSLTQQKQIASDCFWNAQAVAIEISWAWHIDVNGLDPIAVKHPLQMNHHCRGGQRWQLPCWGFQYVPVHDVGMAKFKSKEDGCSMVQHPSVNLGIISCPKTRACHLKSAALTGSEPFKWLASANNSAQPLHLKQRLRCNTFGKGTISLAQSTTRFIYNLHAVRVSLLNNHSREEDKAIIAATFILFLHEFSFIKSVWRLHASSSTPRFCDLCEKSPISPARGMTPTARLGTWTWDLWRTWSVFGGHSVGVDVGMWVWIKTFYMYI